MTERVSFEDFDREVAAFQVRLQELRTQRILGGEGGDEAAAAAFLELETAAEELRVAHEEMWVAGNELARRTAPNDRDRDVLRVVFRDLPLAVILLDGSGRIRRVNQRAVDLLGATADYLSGKPFPVFVHLPARAALRSHLAAVARGKDEQVITTSLLRLGTSVPARLALSTVRVPADSRPIIMAVVLPGDGRGPSPDTEAADTTIDDATSAGSAYPRPWADRPQAVRAATARLDLVTEVARLLLGEGSSSKAVVMHAVATLLCASFAEWVIIDLDRDGRLTRAAVCGPADPESLSTLSALERAAAGKTELPGAVIETGHSRLDAHVEDPSLLGEDERGVPLLSAMGAHSALCVAIEPDVRCLGAITTLRGRGRDPFSLSEQAALEDVAALLALALRSDHQRAARSPGTGISRAVVSPRSLPSLADLDVASFQRSAGPDGAVPASFLDVYPSPSGWGVLLGATLSPGEEAADYLSMVRQWGRLVGLTAADPGTLLTHLNVAMRRLGEADYLVSASAMHLDTSPARARIQLASAGHRSSLALRADGRVQRTDGGGEPLNTGADACVHLDSTVLEKGELLLLYNDALFDTHNTAGEGFGESDQLRIALARAAGGTAQDALDAVAEALLAFADGVLQHDVLALAIRFTGR